VHLRRALLLFAIVLGLAAVAASVSRPRGADPLRAPPTTTEQQATTPSARPGSEGSVPAPVELTFPTGRPRTRYLRAGQAATVLVEVSEAGQVRIGDLAMSVVAEPLTPARFDVFTRAVGRHSITFAPAGAADQEQRLGTLVVR
jgi:hypothetical protein